MNNREYNIDLLRCIACFMVVCSHCDVADKSNASLLCGILTMPCVPLFFVISGYLLLPLKLNTISFYKRRLLKILFPTLFWTFVYLFCDVMTGAIMWSDLLHAICLIPFIPQGHIIMWFMYALIGLYLISPILSSWLTSAKKVEVELLLGLWLFTNFLPVFSDGKLTGESHASAYYYISGFVGYYVLGYYFKKFQKISCLLSLLFIMIPASVMFLSSLYRFPLFAYDGPDFLSVSAILMCVGWFNLCLHMNFDLSKIQKKWLATLSALSFGVYYVHILMARFLVHGLRLPIDGYPDSALLMVLTCWLSFVLIYLISRIPLSQYIIGCNLKQNKIYDT